jgi:hypothetical protein
VDEHRITGRPNVREFHYLAKAAYRAVVHDRVPLGELPRRLERVISTSVTIREEGRGGLLCAWNAALSPDDLVELVNFGGKSERGRRAAIVENAKPQHRTALARNERLRAGHERIRLSRWVRASRSFPARRCCAASGRPPGRPRHRVAPARSPGRPGRSDDSDPERLAARRRFYGDAFIERDRIWAEIAFEANLAVEAYLAGEDV